MFRNRLKIIVLLASFLFICSCGKTDKTEQSNTKKTIAVSIYPLKLILNEIVGDKIDVVSILPAGASPHTFEPKPSDISKLHYSSLVFYVDDNLDGWIAKLNTNNPIALLNLLDKRSLLANTCHHDHESEEHEGEDEHDHDIDHEFEHEHNHGAFDPHFWTSPVMVRSIVPNLTDYIIQIDPENEKFYSQQRDNFINKLNEFIEAKKTELEKIKEYKLFTFHNSFSYFIRDFGLQFGGVLEESPGKEAGTQYIYNISKTIEQSNTKAIFIEPQLNHKMAEIIAKELNLKLYTLDPIGNEKEFNNYFDLINYNITTLKTAFNK